MSRRAAPAEQLAEAFAYVDNCLDPAARRAFDARLACEPDLRRQVAQWQAQNREIRCAFGAPARDPLELGRVSNENAPRRAPEPARLLRDGLLPEGSPHFGAPHEGAFPAGGRPFGQTRLRTPPAPPPERRRAPPGRLARASVAALTLALALLTASPPDLGPRAPEGLLEAGLAAARALAPLPVEFADDGPALARHFGPRLAFAPPQAAGLRLIGARLAPGEQRAAALYVYEDVRGNRATLMIEPLDETAPAPARKGALGAFNAIAWTGAGYGYVAAASQPDDLAALAGAAALDH